MELEIQHDKERRRFFSIIEGNEAYLTYINHGEKVLNFNHTYVPFSLRGKSIAGQIVEYALNYARENNFKVIPGCSYVRTYLERNKQFSDLVED